ncbi:MAG: hypothetical protein KDC37_01290 [Flavobacteriales bacterium]|nr:hypothetical protein [Flavobacteriales bacterium]
MLLFPFFGRMWIRLVGMTLWLSALLILGYIIPRHNTSALLLLYSSAFLAWWWLSNTKIDLLNILAIGILARIVILPATPLWSDDFYRFIWDGVIVWEGGNPWKLTPAEWLSAHPQFSGSAYYKHLNSQHYLSVYPPVMQVMFALSAPFGGITAKVMVLKFPLLIAEVFSLGLLYKYAKIDKSLVKAFSLYALHPLIIIEGVGNIHHEVMLIPFLLMTFYTNRSRFSVFFVAVAAAIKLTPVIWIPLVIFRSRKILQAIFTAAVVVSIGLLPIVYSGALSEFASALHMFSTEFSFISLFALPSPYGWPIALLIIAALSLWAHPRTVLLIGLVYLVLSPTLHPWYLLPIIALNLKNGYGAVWLWSYTIVFSYIHYATIPYASPWWLKWCIHMPVVLYFLYENMPFNFKNRRIELPLNIFER